MQVIFNSISNLGDVICHSDPIVMTAIKPDERDDSEFYNITVNYTPPTLEEVVPEDIIFFPYHNRNQYIEARNDLYYKAIMPDWVDVTDGIIPDPEPPQLVLPTPDEKIEYEDWYMNERCSNQYAEVTYPPQEFIGKNGFSIFRSPEVFVEYCHGVNTILKPINVYELDSTTVMVSDETGIDIDFGTGNISGSSGAVKAINITSNKNNFFDLYIDLEGILTIENLPNGLTYKNKHITGVPLRSGIFASNIRFDKNITNDSNFTIRFTIPELERIM